MNKTDMSVYNELNMWINWSLITCKVMSFFNLIVFAEYRVHIKSLSISYRIVTTNS